MPKLGKRKKAILGLIPAAPKVPKTEKQSPWKDVPVTSGLKPEEVLKGEALKKFRAESRYQNNMQEISRQSHNTSRKASKKGRGNKPQVVPMEVKVPLEATLPGKDEPEKVIVKVKTKRTKLIFHRKRG